jgi:hypothetical protein
MVDRPRQLEVPKYLRPRTDTPKLTVGYGGCFTAIYSVRGAGGYQMFGITPVPIYDPKSEVDYISDETMCLFGPATSSSSSGRPGAYDARHEAEVAAGRFAPKMRPVTFSLDEFNADIDGYNKKLEGDAQWLLRSRHRASPPRPGPRPPGYYHLGIPLSGAMDRWRWIAPTCSSATTPQPPGSRPSSWARNSSSPRTPRSPSAAPNCRPRLDGEAQPTWTSFAVKAGQTLSFDYLKKGAGPISRSRAASMCPVVLGSRSTYALGGLGGFTRAAASGRRHR